MVNYPQPQFLFVNLEIKKGDHIDTRSKENEVVLRDLF